MTESLFNSALPCEQCIAPKKCGRLERDEANQAFRQNCYRQGQDRLYVPKEQIKEIST